MKKRTITSNVPPQPPAATPARELLVFENQAVRDSLLRGMAQAAAGETHDLGDFTQYLADG